MLTNCGASLLQGERWKLQCDLLRRATAVDVLVEDRFNSDPLAADADAIGRPGYCRR